MTTPPVSTREESDDFDDAAGTLVTPHPTEATSGLRGRLGVPGLVFAVLALASPLAGVAGYLAFVIASGNGLGAPVAILAMGLVVLIFSIGYVKMAELVPNPGGFYAYVTAGLGRAAGLGMGMLITLGYTAGTVGFYTFGGLIANGTVNALGGPDIPWWVYTVAFIAIVSALTYRGLDASVRVMSFLLALEVGIVLIVDQVVTFRGGPSGRPLEPFTMHAITSGSVPMAALFALLLFTGFEVTTLFREEVKDPAKTIRRSTYIAVAVIAVLFAYSAWCLITAFGVDNVVAEAQADPTGIFSVAVQSYLGSTMMTLTSLLLITSVFASQLGVSNSVCRYLYSMGKDGVLASALGRAHDTRHSPHRAAVTLGFLNAGVTIIVVAFRYSPIEMFTWSAFTIALAILASYFLVSVTVFVFLLRKREAATPRTLLLSGIAVVAFGVMLLLALLNPAGIAGQESVLNYLIPIVLLAVFVGGALYAVYLRNSRPDVYRRIGRQETL
ncbi:APC family permease [Rhodococcus sp. NPDC057014]|uniref:APC family permease n=1 Tax=Rhodococcus sp. NPDC057014 TaxID=3346000 RepID=UPI003625F661